MSLNYPYLVKVWLLAAILTPPALFGAVPGQTATPAIRPIKTQADELIKQLNSPDPAVQTAARRQAELVAAMMNRPEFVEALLATTTDKELKAFLTDRLAKLKSQERDAQPEKLAGLSFNVVNAGLPQVVEAMNNSLAGSMTVRAATTSQNTGTPGNTYTLEANNMPLWQVFAALSRQHLLSPAVPGAGQLDLVSTDQSELPWSASGDAVAFVHGFTYNRAINLQTSPVQTKAQLKFDLHMLADPRVRSGRLTDIKVTQAQIDGVDVPVALAYLNPNQRVNDATYTITLAPEFALGKSMSFACNVSLYHWVGETLTSLENVSATPRKEVTAGNAIYWISTLTLEEPGTLKISGRTDPRYPKALAVSARLVDAKGLLVCSCRNVPITTSPPTYVIHPNNFTPPFRLEISAPNKEVTSVVHFEFKDVLLPSR